MSAEVTAKKRGRPKKAVVVEDVVEEVEVAERGNIARATKTRAKKSSSTSSSTATALSPTTASASSTRRAKELVQGAGIVEDVESAAAPVATKRKVVAVKSAPSSTPASVATLKAKTSPAGSRATSRSAAVDAKSEAASLESAPSQSKKRARSAGSSVAAAPSVTKPHSAAGGEAHLAASGSESATAIEVQHSRKAGSKILQQATAFSTGSDELEIGVSEGEERKQVVQAQTLIQEDPRIEKPPQLDEGATIAASSGPSPSQPTHALPPTPTMPFGFRTPPIPQVRAYSSTSPLPMSTTVALAARQSGAHKLPPRPTGPTPPTEPRHPAPFQIPSEVPIGPRPPKLSEMPLEQRKKDPKYRKATIRYTAAIVAMPFLIVSSWLLWEKYQEHQLYLERVREAKRAKPNLAVTPVTEQQLARPASPTSTPLAHETK